eukprot:1136985-Pelagomonas_calceolata.AAC.6
MTGHEIPTHSQPDVLQLSNSSSNINLIPSKPNFSPSTLCAAATKLLKHNQLSPHTLMALHLHRMREGMKSSFYADSVPAHTKRTIQMTGLCYRECLACKPESNLPIDFSHSNYHNWKRHIINDVIGSDHHASMQACMPNTLSVHLHKMREKPDDHGLPGAHRQCTSLDDAEHR